MPRHLPAFARVPILLSTALALLVASVVIAGSSHAATTPSYTNYPAPNGLGTDAGEPSVGSNWSSGNTMFQAGLQTLRVSWNGANPPAATWTDVTWLPGNVVSLDPILFTDRATSRTFVSQLTAGCSNMAITDNDGASWLSNPVGCGIAAGADHQTVGGGSFHAPLGPNPTYADASYYCAQAVVTAQCALSPDGGVSWNPSVPIYNATQCSGLHGHVKVAPDGTAYVPNADCGGKQAVVVSTDNGSTWTVRKVGTSATQDESDPSLALGSAGSVYLGWQDGASNATGSTAKIAVSHNQGATWSTPVDVGAAFGIRNVQFPAVVSGDDGRAAFAFLGSTTPGDDQKSAYAGVWHLYVATTYDGGVSWTTVDATPNDPVQRGCIWMAGGSNACRNLLDFMDATVDAQGHVLVAYADGCISGTCVGASGKPADSRASRGTIARQTSGTGLFAAYDGA